MLLKGILIITPLLFPSTVSGDVGVKAENTQFSYSVLIVINCNNSTSDHPSNSYVDESYCSGALISENFVITAGLCAEGIQKFRIKIGARINGDNTGYVYDHIINTKPFLSTGHVSGLVTDHAVALIALNPRCTFTPEIQPVTLANANNNASDSVVVVGYNTNNQDKLELQWLQMQLKDVNCKEAYPEIDIRAAICAQGELVDDGTRGSFCRSLGSALVDGNNTLIGISVGQILSPCEDGPQIFARIRWFNSWIRAALEITNELHH